MLHEYYQVIRQWNPGDLTVTRYLIESARNGYVNNRFELEAEEFAVRHLETFNRMTGR